jgi:hypothetical protein
MLQPECHAHDNSTCQSEEQEECTATVVATTPRPRAKRLACKQLPSLTLNPESNRQSVLVFSKS